MLHKFTALILSCLMLVLATTSQVGLNFCLCDKIMFLGDCPCELTTMEPSSDQCTSCNGCSNKSTPPSTLHTSDISPCDNCVVSLDWELDQCVPQPSVDFKTSPDSLLNALYFVANTTTSVTPNAFLQPVEIRGSPPELMACPSVPLYIRHSVFLI
ncbi:MAG: hypothetical protein ACSHX6_04975 [Akkermansiaceae bacterium]